MSEFSIVHEDHETHGRYVIRLDNGDEAEMTYAIRGPGIRDFNHTYVPEIFRGTGVAGQLMERAITDARDIGFKIVPSCSYVAVQFRRHPEWRELMA